MDIDRPHIQPDVPGPDGRRGFLLVVPRSEALEWDIRAEVGSTSRLWIRERQAWWIAAAYLQTAEAIVERFVPAPATHAREAPPHGRLGWAPRASRGLGILAALRARWPSLGALLGR